MESSSVTVKSTLVKLDKELAEYSVFYDFHPASSPSSQQLPTLVLAHPFNNSREYWKPQIEDPLLASYSKIVLDSLGFAKSKLSPDLPPWNFALAAQSIIQILEQRDLVGVVVGDSMGGGPTGLRCALLDASRSMNGEKKRIAGVVAIGTSAEEESADFVAEYTEAAHAFAAQCREPSVGPSKAISILASNMASDGYTPAESTKKDREWGAGVIDRSLHETLSQNGILDPMFSGQRMIINYACLNNRPSLILQLSARPSPLRCPILVIHGGLDKAYPLERGYHERTAAAIGDQAELLVIEDGPHFVSVTHYQEVDAKIVDWISRRIL